MALATAVFARGERVDLQGIADRLQVGRSTLYRWVGDREQLLDAVMAAKARDIWTASVGASRGRGIDRVLDSARRFMANTAADPGLVALVEKEPAMALRVLMNPEGQVPTQMARSLEIGVRTALPEAAELDPAVFTTLARAATALVWANVAAGHEPQVETAVTVMRAVLTTALADA